MATQVDNTAQVDNSESYLYVTRYCGPLVKNGGDPKRVEIHRQGDGPAIADVTWEEFKGIICLGQELIERCNFLD
ncbi:hypothetical protein LCGC14_2852150 [marine sediment metagenome]|uniref:Uncharacterized protein n=1 Tax=marine sediment metagenome TaxID=412755 RepID=A0A0F8Y889_9ZZZZ